MTVRAGRREWIGLAVLILPILIASMDVSVLFFAVPFIAQDLQPTASQQLWIFDIYGFVLAGLLLTMGSLGDRIGRRRLLLIGAVAFSAASLLAAYAQTAEMLIAARAVLGVAGATLMPSTLALIRNLFHDEADRTKAVAIWSAALTGGVTIGPIISGVLLEHFWWGSVFLINIPAMLLLVVTAPFLVPESKGTRSARFDWLSSLFALGTVIPVIAGIKSVASDGWSTHAVLYATFGLLVGVAFVRRQLTAEVPMLDVRALAERRFGGSVVINVLAMFAIMGNAVILTQYLQSVLGFSPLAAALWSLVPSVAVGAAAPLAAVLAPRLGRPVVMAAGFVVSVVGFVLISRVDSSTALWIVLVAAGLISGGLVVVLSLITDYVVGVAPAERAGSVAGLVETSSELGGALGMALLGSVLAAVYRAQAAQLMPAGLPPAAAEEAGQTLAGAVTVSAQLPGALGEAVLEAGRAAYTAAMHSAALAAAGVLVLATVLTLVLLRGTDPTQAESSEATAAAEATAR
jgi:DHA2 family multidrug resistance protein-like MFS transporter